MRILKYIFVMMLLFSLLITACTPDQTATLSPTYPPPSSTPPPTDTLKSPTPTLLPSPSPIPPKPTEGPSIETVMVPDCIEDASGDTQIFNELIWSLYDNLYEADGFGYRTLYRYTMGGDYADDDLSVDVSGTYSGLLDAPTEGFFYPLASQKYEHSHVIMTDLSSGSRMETIVTEGGVWARQGNDWIFMDSTTSADMLNLADMFSPEWVLAVTIGGGGGTLSPGIRADEPTMAQAETVDGREVMHRCWVLEAFEENINAYLIHYESLYTFLNIEVHLWTAEDDSQLVRLVLVGEHSGERLGEYEGNWHDTPRDFILSMEVTDYDQPVDITAPDSDEIALTIPMDTEAEETLSAPYNEFPLPDDAELVEVTDEEDTSTPVPREYWYPEWEVPSNVLGYYYGSSWYQAPEERRPTYTTEMDLVEATSFYLEEMGRLGWRLDEKYLQLGWPKLYLIFEKNEAIMPVVLETGVPGVTQIFAILPPADDVLEAVLSGWINYTTEISDLNDDGITAIASDAQGRVWLGTRKGLNVLDSDEWTTYSADDLNLPISGSDFEVTALAVDRQDQVWVGTREGFSVYDGETWKTYTAENSGFVDDPVEMSVDSAGRIWMANGYSETVSVFNGNNFAHYGPEDVGQPGGHAVDAIAVDGQDRIWIGTSGGGVYVFDENTWETVQKAKSPANTTNVDYSIEDLAIDEKGWVWVGSGEGLSFYDGETWTTYNTQNSDIVDDWVKSLGIDASNRVWLATTGGSLNMLDANGEWKDYTPMDPEISLYFPGVLYIDAEGRIWVVSDYYGISVFAPPNSTPISAAPPVPTPTPRAPTKSIGGECLGSAENAIVDLDCRKIIIAGDNARLPFNYVLMETNEPGGWDYDAWDEICTRLHCTPVYEEAYWGELIQAVADDQYDVAANGIAIRPKRAEIVDFSEGYISIKQRLLVRSDEIRITEIEDLVNDHSLNLGAIRGTDEYVTAYEYLSSHERIHGFETRTSAVQALISGDIDALIVTDIAGLGYVGEDADEVKLVGRQLTSEWLGFIYPKGSDLIDPVNLALQTMMEDGFLDDLNMKYFGPGFTITYDDIGPGIYGE